MGSEPTAREAELRAEVARLQVEIAELRRVIPPDLLLDGDHTQWYLQTVQLRENERRARQIAETLQHASMALIQSLDLNQVLEALLDYLQKLVPYDSANVMLRDGWIFQVYSLRGYAQMSQQMQVRLIHFDAREHRITREILETQRSLIIRDTHGYPGWVEVASVAEVRSWMGIPIMSHGELLGIFSVNKEIPDFFTPEAVELAETLATMAAAAITNAQLYAQAQQELTERRRAEAALEAERAQLARRVEERTADLMVANAELERASRLKDEFLANMSHELRTPLNTILGRAEILAEGIYGPINQEQHEAVRSMSESGRHLLALINDILDLSKIEAGKLELQLSLVDMVTLCEASIRMVAQSALKKEIRLHSSISPQVDVIYADERRLKQILVNLLSNAVKFTPAGGQVELEVQTDPDQQSVSFTVSDTGIGIAEADMARLFQPFVQIDAGLTRQHDGTGLGLVLVQRLTEAHGGSVAVQSQEGLGSSFTVRLPWLHPQASASLDPDDLLHTLRQMGRIAADVAPVAPPQPLPPRWHILLAEDNEDNISLLLDFLPFHGYALTIARNGQEALDLARECHPDAILMDIQMPVMDGIEAIRRLRADPDPGLAHTPVIALTALAMPGDRDRCLAAGADAYIVKPLVLHDLPDQIAAVMHQS
ncbi:two-component hybrid sensor and regulator [Oscillochloris trichoides DG-6]|uniref:Circadian input-output histidine kinase CikA n=1 Tax=Oscillochloris trichoides DG-6 TaxID=765420 RepID=E1IEF1_9CHLR|nr:ATP-binding protein [Oscillochloris trichoides]EFO80477.1 two-component hybrid sensor and regulator [Oscillochloris trichoides DG-6]